LVLEIPSQRIVAVTERASRMLEPDTGAVIGRTLESFTSDRPALGPDLLAGGRMNGFETFRMVRRRRGPDLKIRMWIRNFDHQPPSQYVLVVVVESVESSEDHLVDLEEAPAVVGTASSDLLVERLSKDAEVLFGAPVSSMIGQPLLGLISDTDVGRCLIALDEASESQRGVTLTVATATRSASTQPHRCEVLILPLQPAPSCAFVFLPTPGGSTAAQNSESLPVMLNRLGRAAYIAELARGIFRGVSEREIPGIGLLTTREFEIVSLLLDGDRPPGIARKLFLSQSTVRNHLASVFSKLGVTSQQEVVDLFRRRASSDGE
jgi:DNA-binding CsgD family transcriptional regulator